MRKSKAPEDLSFEEGLGKLEELVEALEGRTLSLDQALASFEEGLKLSKLLSKKLKEAEGRVEILTKDLAGRPGARPFETDGDDEDGEAGDEDDD